MPAVPPVPMVGWDEFLADYWEKKPARIQVAAGMPFIRPERAFVSLVNAVEQGFHEKGSLRWMDERGKTQTPAQTLLPRTEDRSVEGYIERLRQREGLSGFFIQLFQLHAFDRALSRTVAEFVQQIAARAGLPAGRVWTDIYIGLYSATPFGIHLDDAENFTFGLSGKKTLYLWEPATFKARIEPTKDLHNYKRFLDDAIELPVGEGELIYWPRRFYHIADSAGAPSVTANIAFYSDPSVAERISRLVAGRISAKLGTRNTAAFELPSKTANSELELPRGLQDGLDTLAELMKSGELERDIKSEWAKFATGSGLHPSMEWEAGVRADDVVRCRSCVYVLQLGDEEVELVGNGKSAICANHPAIRKLAGLLKPGSIHRLKELLPSLRDADPREPLDEETLLELFGTLREWDVIELHPSSVSSPPRGGC